MSWPLAVSRATSAETAALGSGATLVSPGNYECSSICDLPDITRLIPHLEKLHERLADAVVENLPYDEFITRYDRPTTLFCLDPPYYGSENDYGRWMFDRSDF